MDAEALLARAQAVSLPDRYPEGVGKYDCWKGYRFKAARGQVGLIVEPEEGGGNMPTTYLPLEKAVADLEALAAAVAKLDDGAPGSYLGEVVQELATDMQDALLKILGRPA